MDTIIKFHEEQFFPYLVENNIKQVIHLGDIFDRRKYINFNTLNLFNTHYIENLKKHNIKIDHIIGNHDTFYKSTNEVNSLKEIYGENYSDNIKFYWSYRLKEYDGIKFLLMPWIPNTEIDHAKDIIENSECPILIGHFDINGFQVMPGQYQASGFDPKLFASYESVFTGHYHIKQSVGNIHYLGAPYETSWGDYNTQKGFHVFDTQTRKLEYIPNNDKLHHKIIYDGNYNHIDFNSLEGKFIQIIVKNNFDPKKYENFMTNIYDAGPAGIQTVEDFSILKSIDNEELENAGDTLDLIKSHISELQNISVNTELVFNYFNDLYKRAITDDLDYEKED